MFKDFELPFVPTVVVGFVLLMAVVASLSDVRFYHDCGCRFDGAPVCHACTGSLSDPLKVSSVHQP